MSKTKRFLIHDFEKSKTLKKVYQDRIQTWILPRIVGKKNVMTSDQIATKIKTVPDKVNQGIRAAMKEFLLIKGIPVVANHKGFYIATEPKDFDLYLKRLNKSRAGIVRNIGVVEEMRQRMIDGI